MNTTISEWVEGSKIKKRSIIEIKPEHFGKQYQNLSEKIDDIYINMGEFDTP